MPVHRARLLVLAALTLLATGCPVTKRLPLAAGTPSVETSATITEQHEYGGPNLGIEAVDGRRMPPDSIWRVTRWEVELTPGAHTIEVSYFDGQSNSTQNALLPFTAEPGGHYEVRGARLKDGFWSELGTQFAASLWPFVKGNWVAWIVDTRTGTTVAGVEPEQGTFRVQVKPQAEPAP